LVLMGVFSSLLVLVQIVCVFLYVKLPRYPLLIEGSSFRALRLNGEILFHPNQIERWHYFYETGYHLEFELTDGRNLLLYDIARLSPEEKDALSKAIGFGSDRRNPSPQEAPQVASYTVYRNRKGWLLRLIPASTFCSLVTAWFFVGFVLGDSASGLQPYHPVLAIFGSVFACLSLAGWVFTVYLLSLSKIRAVFEETGVRFRYHGRYETLPYSELVSFSTTGNAFGSYFAFTRPTLHLRTKEKDYAIRFVVVSQIGDEQIKRLSGAPFEP
jgi:hypothetical protein